MSPMDFFTKLKVITWKNGIIRRRHWCWTICEAIIPALLFLLIAYARSQIKSLSKLTIDTPTYTEYETAHQLFLKLNMYDVQFLYTPNNDFTQKLIETVQLKLEIPTDKLRGFMNQNDLMNYYQVHGKNLSTYAMVFKNIPPMGIPKKLDYDLRIQERHLHWPTDQLFESHSQYVPDSGSDLYRNFGFMTMMWAIDESFIEMASGLTKMPVEVTLQEFPYPPYTQDMGISEMFMYILPLVTLLSFAILCPVVLKRIVEEKESGIKELMKIMGLKQWMLWLGWLLHALMVNIISIILIVIFMKVNIWTDFPPIEYTDGCLLFVFLFLYCTACIVFCFAISTLFNNPNVALVFGILIWLLSYFVPHNFVLDDTKSPALLTWGFKMLLSVFPNVALTLGYNSISLYETREIGAHWYNLFQSASGGKHDITMGNIFIMLVVDIVLFGVFTFYMDSINPGKYGIAKSWNFPISGLTKKIKTLVGKNKIGTPEHKYTGSVDPKFVEEKPGCEPGIEVRKLKKWFGAKAALNGIDLKMYEGEISVLLGHNGAGKTTVMSIMTGLISATEGDIIISNKNIKDNMDVIYNSIGICPQHNMFFTDLTVKEHLIFFARLKGLSYDEANEKAKVLLQQLHLDCKKNSLPGTLSGGMKRKLNLGISLIGNPKVLILDEPTSGMDIESRREIWDILLEQRKSKTILVSTHFMEEADTLGDRIAIMDHGNLICCGSPMFLRSAYGAGYYLTLSYSPLVEFNQLAATISRDIKEEQEHFQLENVKLIDQKASGNRIIFLMPADQKDKYSRLLKFLEDKKYEGVTDISVKNTTMEEIFLRAGYCTESSEGGAISVSELINNATAMHPAKKYLYILQKKFFIFKKKFSLHLLQLAIAMVITILTLHLGTIDSGFDTKSTDEFPMTLKAYKDNTVIYGGPDKTPMTEKIMHAYKEEVSAQKGQLTAVRNVHGEIISRGIDNILFYKQHMIVAAEFNKTSDSLRANAMFANGALHGAPISLNLVMNAILKSTLNDSYSISTSNTPLPSFVGTSQMEQSSIKSALLWIFLYPLGLLFLVAIFIIFPHMDRSSYVKTLQYMCGIRTYFYWPTIFLFDFILYLIQLSILVFIIWIYSEFFTVANIFGKSSELLAVWLIGLAYGICGIPFAYLFSYKRTASGGLSSLIMCGLASGIILTTIVMALEHIKDEYWEGVGKVMYFISMFIPQFSLTYVSAKLCQKAVWNFNWDIMPLDRRMGQCSYDTNPCCGKDEDACSAYKSYFRGEDHIWFHFLWMVASGVLYYLVLCGIDVRKQFLFTFRNLKNKYTKNVREADLITSNPNSVSLNTSSQNTSNQNTSNNTFDTKTSVSDMANSSNPDSSKKYATLKAKHIQKRYGNKEAVKNVSFEVEEGECFGLLGANGAGKSTTFRMLSGEESPESGTIHIKKGSSTLQNSDFNKYQQEIGYCPQFDAINEDLTGREMLTLFAHLRGVQGEEVDQWIKNLDLEEYADERCGDYSGGNKRKLNFGMSVIGYPHVILLDEPTTGVDPRARRKLWDIIRKIKERAKKSSLILTSHSMDECEMLCDRLGIMKDGVINSTGTISQLKKEYEKGFTVTFKVKPLVSKLEVVDEVDCSSAESSSEMINLIKKSGSTDTLEKDIKRKLLDKLHVNDIELLDEHMGMLSYRIPDKKRWSQIFTEMENLKSQPNSAIEDYTVSETTLEEVFLAIARKQERQAETECDSQSRSFLTRLFSKPKVKNNVQAIIA